jgi:hypothetical protein
MRILLLIILVLVGAAWAEEKVPVYGLSANVSGLHNDQNWQDHLNYFIWEANRWYNIPGIDTVSGYDPKHDGEYIDCDGKTLFFGCCAVRGIAYGCYVKIRHPKYGDMVLINTDRINRRHSNRADVYVSDNDISLLIHSGGVKAWVATPEEYRKPNGEYFYDKNEPITLWSKYLSDHN